MVINELKVLAVIPARGGSKGLPRKNILNLCGKPLIAWSIEQARKSKYIDRVIVSTEDQEIANVAKKYGADVPFLRPIKLADDNASPTDAILDVLEKLEKISSFFDIVIELQPTCCIRTPEDIDMCLKKLIYNSKAKSIISVVPILSSAHPDFATKLDDDGFVRGPEGFGDRFRRQNISNRYASSGSMLATYVSNIQKYKSFYNDSTLGFILLDKEKTFDINDKWDFSAMEAVMNSILYK